MVGLAVVVYAPVLGVAVNFTELDGVYLDTEPQGKRDVGFGDGGEKGAEQEADVERNRKDFLIDGFLEQLGVLGFKMDKGGFCLQVYLGTPIRALEIGRVYTCSQKQKGQNFGYYLSHRIKI